MRSYEKCEMEWMGESFEGGSRGVYMMVKKKLVYSKPKASLPSNEYILPTSQVTDTRQSPME